jgi:hypothetical protein
MAANNNRINYWSNIIQPFDPTYKNLLANSFYRMTFRGNAAGEQGAPNITSIPTQICN